MLNKPEMRNKKKLVVDRTWMDEVLREGQMLCLALASPDGDPYALPMNYGYEEGVIYIHGAIAGMKKDMIAANPKASFNVTLGVEIIRDPVPSNFSCKFKSVTGFGEIKEITGLAEKNRALEILMRQYDGPHKDLDEAGAKAVWVAKLVIGEMTGKASGHTRPGE